MPEPRRMGWVGRMIAPLFACVLALLVLSAGAKEAVPEAADPVLEARMLAIAGELRCLVCQNETIAASHADLAVDLRKQIRSQLTAGRSQQQIIDYMVARYGEFVLYRPPLQARTLLLWLGPFVLLAVGAVVMAMQIRRRRRAALAQPWSAEQSLRARALLDDAAGGS